MTAIQIARKHRTYNLDERFVEVFISRVDAKKDNTSHFFENLLWKKARASGYIASGVNLLGETHTDVCIFDTKVKAS